MYNCLGVFFLAGVLVFLFFSFGLSVVFVSLCFTSKFEIDSQLIWERVLTEPGMPTNR